MIGVVEVRTGARLHFGLFATTPPGGPFGGIGLMIDRPGFVLQAWRTKRDRAFTSPELAGRITEFVAGVRADLQRPCAGRSVEEPMAPVAFRVVEAIPSHRGFGSGTQLAYAVATAMARVLDVWPLFRPDHDLGRGKRSAVGTLGFGDGGFIADAGLEHGGSVESRWSRRDVPSDWRFVIVDPLGPAGPAGAAESAGFQALAPMPRSTTEGLLDLLAEEILPGLDRSDFARFAGGVTDFNRRVGEHFAPVQGGVYAHPLIRSLSKTLSETEWPYLAQSSWGPAAVAPCESEGSANELIAFLNRHVAQDEANVFVAKPMNRGATVSRFRKKFAFGD